MPVFALVPSAVVVAFVSAAFAFSGAFAFVPSALMGALVAITLALAVASAPIGAAFAMSALALLYAVPEVFSGAIALASSPEGIAPAFLGSLEAKAEEVALFTPSALVFCPFTPETAELSDTLFTLFVLAVELPAKAVPTAAAPTTANALPELFCAASVSFSVAAVVFITTAAVVTPAAPTTPTAPREG